MTTLSLNGVSKTYLINDQPVEALAPLHLTINAGSFVVVVGRSGSGKTTLLKLISGLEEKTCGDIRFSSANAKIGMVFQEPRLMPWLTAEENMALPLLREQDQARVRQTVTRHLELLGLENFRTAYPWQLSGGMAQRVALGRALCCDPDLILMDEPLSALDAFTRKKLQNKLVDIFRQETKTILFVTHDVDEAVLLGQRILIMEEGRLLDEFEVPLSYPRDTSSREFFDIRETILRAIIGSDWEEY
ncbi:MAG TPA: ABC transporter ATP-binding protein [Patescibacteria group bacterium]|nr:ABC transporter ATP-binding protein [Patescibacteria group bacterium]